MVGIKGRFGKGSHTVYGFICTIRRAATERPSLISLVALITLGKGYILFSLGLNTVKERQRFHNDTRMLYP